VPFSEKYLNVRGYKGITPCNGKIIIENSYSFSQIVTKNVNIGYKKGGEYAGFEH